MARSELLVLSIIVILSAVLPALCYNGPSLRGVLQALERRRRAPPGISYPLSSFRYPERTLEYLEANDDELSEKDPEYFDSFDDRRKRGKLYGYMDRDVEYLPDEYNFKKSAFRERMNESKNRRKKLIAKKRSSLFRERADKHDIQSEQLKELFLRELEEEEERERESQLEADTEYVDVLKELWERYKFSHPEGTLPENVSGYSKKNIKKRQIPGEFPGWGPVAFKRKRSPNQRLDGEDTPNNFLYSLKYISQNDPSLIENLKDDKISDEGDDPDISKIISNKEQEPHYIRFGSDGPDSSDIRDEYMVSLQPINNDDLSSEEDKTEDLLYTNERRKRFPVTKRSKLSVLARRDLVKRNSNTDKRSAGTNSKVLKDLSSIFGIENEQSSRLLSKPVKRSNTPDENSHEIKAPTAGILHEHQRVNTHHEDSENLHNHQEDSGNLHNHQEDSGNLHNHNHTDDEHDNAHSRHEHESRPPLLSGPSGESKTESEHSHESSIKSMSDDKSQLTLEHPIILKKKSIDWSNYFGMDKRKKKSYDNFEARNMRNLYSSKAKRNLNQYIASEMQLLSEPVDEPINEDSFQRKHKTKDIEEIKLDNMDNKLKNMETVIVDEALQYSAGEEGLDTKEQQEVKEKILSRLAAAYSLEKMRKALKEFKTSLQSQRKIPEPEAKEKPFEEAKKKKSTIPDIADKQTPDDNREKLEMDFEGEQGAGHYLNGPDEPLSEGYMGGSGMRNRPTNYDGLENGQCPVLNRIVNRCQSIDILAGDYGQLFLPLCSLHQICYLCGPSSPTGCDLIFLSEADSVCGGRTKCQQTARSTLMVLREEHDSLADDLEGECERGSCLYQTLENNSGWQHTYYKR